MNKLINCGCGGAGKIEAYHDILVPGEPINWKRVRCSECNIRTPWRHTEAEAITAWNKAMGEQTAEVYVNYRDDSIIFGFCECGQSVNSYNNYCSKCGCRLEWE
jgi:hypothetical protein